MTSPHSTKSSSSHHSSRPTPKRTKSGCSLKSAALLEETSVHLSLPSFHTKHYPNNKQNGGGGGGGWKCAGCNYENHSTLNNECSVCGMIRNISYHTNTQQDSFSDDSVSSFMNDSGNSLSLDNSFSITDDGAVLLSKEEISSVTATAAAGGSGGGYGVGGKGHASMPTSAFHNSFSSHSGHSGDQSVRSTRTYRGGRRRPTRRAAADRFDDTNNNASTSSLNDSVMSFCHWNGNEKIKPWTCTACTFLNENPLHLVCEMCRQRRDVPMTTTTSSEQTPNDATTAAAAATATAATVIPSDSNSSHDADYCFAGNLSSDEEEAAELQWLQQEQMRELVELQREIMSDFGSRPPSPRRRTPTGRQQQQRQLLQQHPSRFNTSDLQRELDQIGGLTSSSSPRTAAASSLLLFGDSDHSSDDDGVSSETRLKELLAAQKDIMMDFKRKREDGDSYASPVPDKKAASRTITPTAISRTPVAASTSASSSSSPHRPRYDMLGSNNNNNNYNSLGASSATASASGTTNTSINNTAPAAGVSLKESMKAAGGKLRHEDLCLPFLWGDTSWYDNNNNSNNNSSVSKGGKNDGTGKGGNKR